jgi:ABC-2 type transport system ATP-binding protein
MMATPILEAIDLCKNYGSFCALDGVSFQVAEGEIFGLLGPNGAGKTTLLSIASGLLAPTGGQVRILGKDLQSHTSELKRAIGIVPQDLAIYPELTAQENLRFFAELYGIRGAELDKRIAETLAMIGLEEHARQRAGQFSGGMKRRLNLGVALMHQPRLLLLDEPTAGVDPQSRNHIFEEVRRLNAAGMTIVYTSHYMEEVQALCPRIGIIDHGKLVACDAIANLLRLLPGLIRFRVPVLSPSLRQKLQQLDHAHLKEQAHGPQGTEHLKRRRGDHPSPAWILECQDVKATLLQLVALLQEAKAELTSLEMEEPNLERVFLHLTGRALRD